MEILLIDDEHHFRELLQLLFDSAGHHLATSENAKKGVELASQKHFDLILMDINMPGTDGLTACRLLKGSPSTQNTPIFLISGERNIGKIEYALKAGANGFISKPIQRECFTQMVEQKLLRRNKKASPRRGWLAITLQH